MRTVGTFLAVLGVFAIVHFLAGAAHQVSEKPPKGKITVGKETTYVTGPLDKDGYVDYVAALHERLSKGITPENNANVLIWIALGPRPEGGRMSAEFFRLLGIPEPPQAGPYFKDLFRYVQDNTKIDVQLAAGLLNDQLEEIGERPWKRKDFPLVAEWLDSSQQALAVIETATRRSHYYGPLVPSSPDNERLGLSGALLPSVQKCRGLAITLVGRAMFRVDQGDHEGAWQDLMTCHRLGRLLAEGGTLIEFLVGVAIDSIASHADVVFLASSQPDTLRVEKYLGDLQKLPRFPAVADKVDLCERFMFLENIARIDRLGIRDFNALDVRLAKTSEERAEFKAAEIDWDPALRAGNRWFDRVAAAMREKDRGAREKELGRIEAVMNTLKKERVDSGKAIRLLNESQSAAARGQILGEVLLALRVPVMRKMQLASDRIQQIQNNLSLAFALEAHRRQHGQYPKELDALAPRYLKQIPLDLFSGKAMIYRPTADGYLLYSVGQNGKDDGGQTYGEDPAGDDLRVRMPPPELRRQ
jgi:hypothetical protein